MPNLTADELSLADQIISVFENDTPTLQYGYAENLDDGRGITAGRAGFTSATGDMLEVVERYTALAPDNLLTGYLPALRVLAASESDATTGLAGLPAAWAKAADDPLFRHVQDSLVNDWYYQPAMDHAADIGASDPLTLLALYDTIIQHGDGTDPDGLPALLDHTIADVGGTPKTGVDELTFLRDFLAVRHADLLNPSDQTTQAAWADSVGRVDALTKLLDDGNISLTGPLTIDPYGDSFTLTAAPDAGTIHLQAGTAAADRLAGGVAADSLYGGEGDDRLFGHDGNDLLEGGSGHDFISGGAGDDVALGGDGNDSLYAGQGDLGNDTFIGGAGDDVIGGGAGDDLIVGGGLDDGAVSQLSYHAFDATADGSDTLYGGSGNDTLLGGGWDDGAVADNGHFDIGEQVTGGTAANVIWAGGGDDLAYGADGMDQIGGGAGADNLYGAGGHDVMYGGTGNDRLDGGDGTDALLGGAGNDTLIGGAGADTLYGGAGNDSMDGGAGNDTLWAGAGDDTLAGGAGADVFMFGKVSGNDTVSDFDPAADLLNLRYAGTGFHSLADLQAAATDGGGGVVIDLGGGQSLFLAGVSLDQLTADDVVF